MVLLYHSQAYTDGMQVAFKRDICTLMFIAALFTAVKLWNQSKCPKIMNG
jgi:hypothetical protein